jgi:hypothetical protein
MAKNSKEKENLRDIERAIKIFPKVVAEKERAFREKEKILKNFAPLSRKLKKLEENDLLISKSKVHPWRKCPVGQHWVGSHPLHVPVSAKNPEGITIRDGHCRNNPSGKDQIYADELIRISEEHFGSVTNLPSADNLDKENGNDYDRLIAGWTQYWNEVLKPTTQLDPNLVKTLISTETDFKVNAKTLASRGNWARGLMQITYESIEILKSEKGELRNFLVNIDQGDAFDPNLNIAAGVRWLFHKKALLEKKVKSPVSWEEAVMEYKSYSINLRKKDPKAIRQWRKFLNRYDRLKNAR